MAFCIIVGTKTFTKTMEEYQGRRYPCHGCPTADAYCQKSWQWFTICWIPVIPFSFGWKNDLKCPWCRQTEDLKHRPEITSGQSGQGQGQGQGHELRQGMSGPGGPPPPGGYGYGPGPGPPPQQGNYAYATSPPPHAQQVYSKF